MSAEQQHEFVVTVSGCSLEQAQQVMNERISPDEDYGFEYGIGYAKAPDEQFVLDISHEFGTVTSIHPDEESAKRQLASYVRLYWEDDAAGNGAPRAADEAPEDDEEAISEYFRVVAYESYSISPA